MRDTFWLIRKTMKTTFKNYKNWLLYIGLPIVVILLATLRYSGSGETALKIGIVNLDRDQLITQHTIHFVNELEGMETSEAEQSDVEELVMTGKVDAALVFPKGFAEGVVSGSPPLIQIISVQGAQVTEYIKSYVNPYIENIAVIGEAVQGDVGKFMAIYEDYHAGDFKLFAQTIADQSVNHSKSKQSIGYLIILMMFSAVTLSGIIIKEKENRTYYRLLASPITARTYVASNVIVNLMVMLIQIIVTLVVMTQFFQMDLGIPFWQMFLILLIFALVAISLSLLIVGIADSSMKANGLQNMIILPTSILAGCMFPLEMMPAAMKRIADFLPQHWLLDTYEKLKNGAAFTSIAMNVAILIAFALTFSLLAIYRFDRNKNMKSFI